MVTYQFLDQITWGPAHFDTVYDFNAPVTILTSYLCSSTSPLHFHIDFTCTDSHCLKSSENEHRPYTLSIQLLAALITQ